MDGRPKWINSGADALVAGVLAGIVTFFALFIWQRSDDENLSEAEALGDFSRPWIESHPILSGLIVFAVVTIGVRLYLFMRRMEERR